MLAVYIEVTNKDSMVFLLFTPLRWHPHCHWDFYIVLKGIYYGYNINNLIILEIPDNRTARTFSDGCFNNYRILKGVAEFQMDIYRLCPFLEFLGSR